MLIWGFPDGSVVKRIHLPMQETLVGSLGGEDPLEEEMATHYSILAWSNLQGQRSLVGFSPCVAESYTTE